MFQNPNRNKPRKRYAPFVRQQSMKYFLTTIFIFFSTIILYSQTTSKVLDTVKIYKNKTGIPYRIYLKEWFFGYGIRHSYSYSPERINKQDILLMDSVPHYFKVYGRTDKLIFEGKNSEKGPELIGDVIYYYKKGTKKRIETWNSIYTKDTCNSSIGLNDAPGKEGTWLYFRRNGKLKKICAYSILVKSCEPMNYIPIITTTKYKRNGRPKRSKVKKTR